MFINDVAKHKQTISFCGINAHNQKRFANKAIQTLQEQARTGKTNFTYCPSQMATGHPYVSMALCNQNCMLYK